jgi:Tfp pilus assembly protein PilX
MNAKAAQNKQGFALATAMLYIAIITAILASVISLILSEYRITKYSTARLQAFYIAEAGIDLALHEFNKEAAGATAWTGWIKRGAAHYLETTPDVLRQESATVSKLSVVADPSALTIVACGSVPSPAGSMVATRTITASLRCVGHAYAIQNWQEK